MWFNPMMRWLLRSPLHGFVSKNTLLISYTGRRTGRNYEIPVNYIRVGDMLLTTSIRDRKWWRNLRGGAPVSLRLQGQDRNAVAEAVEDTGIVAKHLRLLCESAPQCARYLDISLSPLGEPDSVDLHHAAGRRVVIRARIA